MSKSYVTLIIMFALAMSAQFVFSLGTVYAVEPSSEQMTDLDPSFNDDNDTGWTTPMPKVTLNPLWGDVPLVAGNLQGVYMGAKTNKSTYVVGEIIYVTVYVSGLDENKDNEKEVTIRAEGYGIAPVVINAVTTNGTASGVVGIVASRPEAVKADIIVGYGDNQTLTGSVPLTYTVPYTATPTPPAIPNPDSQAAPVSIELSEEGKKGSTLPKTSDVKSMGPAAGAVAFFLMIICFSTVFGLLRKKKLSRSTISSTMYDHGYIYVGRMDIYSERKDFNGEENS